jgi:hypothetical protein
MKYTSKNIDFLIEKKIKSSCGMDSNMKNKNMRKKKLDESLLKAKNIIKEAQLNEFMSIPKVPGMPNPLGTLTGSKPIGLQKLMGINKQENTTSGQAEPSTQAETPQETPPPQNNPTPSPLERMPGMGFATKLARKLIPGMP